MTPYFADDLVTLWLGDCLDVLAELPDCSVDAVVTDPPYGLAELSAATVLTAIAAWMAGDRTHVPVGGAGGFMGREWDRFVPPPGVWDECLRVLKPGGHVLAFAGSRTVDLMTLSIRIAGFEVRDSISWLYGSGFPKSLDVSKAIDRAAGAEREVIGPRVRVDGKAPGIVGGGKHGAFGDYGDLPTVVTAPATEEAARWEGWGTALKPAHEPVVVARKPLAGTVAANVLEHGTGALNIDGCRVASPDPVQSQRANVTANFTTARDAGGPRPREYTDAGRWPPNVLLTHSADCEPVGTRRVAGTNAPSSRGGQRAMDFGMGRQSRSDMPYYTDADGMETVEAWDCAPGCPVAELDAQSGHTASWMARSNYSVGTSEEVFGKRGPKPVGPQNQYGDAGGASRFFPVFRYGAKAPASERPRLEDGTAHPTVKPLELMRWLVRLVTPPGGTVLDPFAGSGTTGQACALEGFSCLLAERDPVSAELAVKRLRKPVQPELLAVTA